MAPVKDVSKIKFFLVDDELKYEEFTDFSSINVSPKTKFIIEQKIGTNPYPASNGQIWHNYASSLEMLTSSGEVIKTFNENDWSFSFSHFGMGSGYSYTHMWIKFVDKIGYANSEEKFDISIDGFLTAYRRFLELSEYDGYRYAKVATENVKLKQNLQQSKGKIKDLETELARLKNILSSVS